MIKKGSFVVTLARDGMQRIFMQFAPANYMREYLHEIILILSEQCHVIGQWNHDAMISAMIRD